MDTSFSSQFIFIVLIWFSNLQFMKQVKKLKSLGFMDDELTDFIKVRETRVDLFPQ